MTYTVMRGTNMKRKKKRKKRKKKKRNNKKQRKVIRLRLLTSRRNGSRMTMMNMMMLLMMGRKARRKGLKKSSNSLESSHLLRIARRISMPSSATCRLRDFIQKTFVTTEYALQLQGATSQSLASMGQECIEQIDSYKHMMVGMDEKEFTHTGSCQLRKLLLANLEDLIDRQMKKLDQS